MSNNYNNQSHINYEHRSAERAPSRKNRLNKQLAAIALTTAVALGITAFATETKTGRKIVEGAKNKIEDVFNVGDDLVKDRFSGADNVFHLEKYTASPKNSNELIFDNGVETKYVERQKLSDDEIFVVEKNASFRSAPVVGSEENDLVTTIARTKNETPLLGVDNYLLYHTDDDYADKFYGFEVEDLKEDNEKLVNDINYDKAKIYWVNESEIKIAKESSVKSLNDNLTYSIPATN